MGVPLFVSSHVLGRDNNSGANEQILIGFIGTGNRARQLMDQMPKAGRIVAIADCYQKRMTETLKEKGTNW